MAGNPERLDRTAKRNLGQHYLREILADADAKDNKRESTPLDFSSVDRTLMQLTRAKIPLYISGEMGFQGLDWRLAGVKAGSRLFIGGRFMPGQEPKPDEASVTIELANRFYFEKEQERKIPISLRIAGVIKNRVVAATYDLEDPENHKLVEASVSITAEDNRYINGNSPISASPLFVDLPSHRSYPYLTSGLITNRMLETVGNPTKAFLIKVDDQGDIKWGNYTQEESRQITEQLGYYAREHKGLIKIGFDKPASPHLGKPIWEVKIPTFL